MVRQSRSSSWKEEICLCAHQSDKREVYTKRTATSQTRLLLLPQCTEMGPSISNTVMLLWGPVEDPADSVSRSLGNCKQISSTYHYMVLLVALYGFRHHFAYGAQRNLFCPLCLGQERDQNTWPTSKMALTM